MLWCIFVKAIRMIIRTTVGDNFIEKVQKINVDVKRDCMTYAFKIIFIQ